MKHSKKHSFSTGDLVVPNPNTPWLDDLFIHCACGLIVAVKSCNTNQTSFIFKVLVGEECVLLYEHEILPITIEFTWLLFGLNYQTIVI